MISDLLIAVKDGSRWTDRFTRYDYREAFKEYCGIYSYAFKTAAADYDSPDKFAGEYMALLSEAIKKEIFFKRAACRIDCKMTIVAFLCPMLEETLGPDFSNAICRAWNDIYKEETIQSTNFYALLDGFRNSVLGIDLENKHFNK